MSWVKVGVTAWAVDAQRPRRAHDAGGDDRLADPGAGAGEGDVGGDEIGADDRSVVREGFVARSLSELHAARRLGRERDQRVGVRSDMGGACFQRRAERGTDVVVGIVETHGRPHTAEQIADLEVIDRAEIVRNLPAYLQDIHATCRAVSESIAEEHFHIEPYVTWTDTGLAYDVAEYGG